MQEYFKKHYIVDLVKQRVLNYGGGIVVQNILHQFSNVIDNTLVDFGVNINDAVDVEDNKAQVCIKWSRTLEFRRLF